jgi:hypothetical protein
MTRRYAGVVLAASLLLLVGVGVAWAFQSTRSVSDGRADLVGPAVTSPALPSSTTAPATPATPMTTPVSAPPVVAVDGGVRADGVPVRLEIPGIGANAAVDPVGLLPNGEMEIPPVERVGWYRLGPWPGSAFGSAVIAGHVDGDGVPGVFARLRELPEGAAVTVTDRAGRRHAFRVVERFQVPKPQLPLDAVFRTDGAPVLTLITCGGAFDASRGHYDDNIVVRAAPA